MFFSTWKKPIEEQKCYTCGASVGPRETELLGGTLLVVKVYMCRKCRLRRWVLGLGFIAFCAGWIVYFGLF